MWKQYMQPTKSARAKVAEPENMRDRLQSLSQAVNVLKEEMKIETSATASNLERIEKQQFGTLNSQVYALKKAFTDLADAMLEEVEGVRNDYRAEMDDFKHDFISKYENLADTQRSSQDNCNKINSSLTQSVKQAFQHMQTIKNQQDIISEDLKSLKTSFSNSNIQQKEFCQHVEQIVHENIKQVTKVIQDSNEIRSKVTEFDALPKQINYIIEKEKERIKLIEEKLSKEIVDIDRKIKFVQKDTESLGNKKEIVEIHNYLANVEFKCEEVVKETKREILQLGMDIERRIDEINKSQENFSSFICNEIKGVEDNSNVLKRIEFLEELSSTQRRELFNSLTSLEQNIYKKQEKIIKAIYQMARKTEMPEALLLL
ncbi:hypothetical protein SteCoe_1538 [Stentor coeruleus]|uniref:Uncharacterized protein n=1 Tax=Stentor coeruleus TaxID=5963 RepID=A0A1R2D1M6_9CILI|nr:hypothetical protein SteCoe_1538 [Stentor coeruleus]